MLPKLFNTPALLGLFSTATFGLVQFLIIALYPALSEALGLSISHLILCFTLGSILFIWSSPFWAKKSDEHGRQKILSVGLAGLSLSFFVLIFLNGSSLPFNLGFSLLLMSRIIYGLTASAIVSVVQAWWRDQAGDVSKNMLSHSMGLNIGRFLAPLLVLMLNGELTYVLWGLAIWCSLLTLAAFCVKSSVVKKSQEATSDSLWDFSFPVVLAFLSTVFIGTIHSNLAHHIQTSLNLSVTQTTLLCSQVLLGSSAMVLLFQFVLKKWGQLKGSALIVSGIIGWIVAAFLFQQTEQTYQLWMSIVFISVGLATITPGYLSFLKAGGLSAGIINSTQTIGLTMGGLIGYFILQGTLSLSVVLYVICLGLLLTLFRLPKNKEVVC